MPRSPLTETPLTPPGATLTSSSHAIRRVQCSLRSQRSAEQIHLQIHWHFGFGISGCGGIDCWLFMLGLVGLER
ncbi:hypothetical protein JTE90_013599 [Oedothorax gibbosus]|uniref:Uncharacterized protein n=1 Tax=Oedothorax gibbosus TaxID=931172 RepID=A0AAV6VGR1_9ARAC|nr:hypothetical protein JTE90_013599 [Oedothorax gibbosus]